jgi:cytochrome c oxidase assembly protein subunit 15
MDDRNGSSKLRKILILKYLSLTSLVVLYSLMFIGGYVSAAGLGLSCPDWPLCPNGIFPSEKYLIEWVHRFVAASTGALVIATTVGCWITKNSNKKIKLTSTLAAIFVITQITLGALVIDLKLHALLVSIHLGIGILLFAMVLLTTLFAFRLGKTTVEARI